MREITGRKQEIILVFHVSQPLCIHNSWLIASIITIMYGLSVFQFVHNLDTADFLSPPYHH